jgi:hypothetical protein
MKPFFCLTWNFGSALGNTGLYERFASRTFSAAGVARGKPAADLFLHTAAKMGVAPAACAVVEDSAFGVQAARAAGMPGLRLRGRRDAGLRLHGPGTIVFHDMRELPELLGQNSQGRGAFGPSPERDRRLIGRDLTLDQVSAEAARHGDAAPAPPSEG